MLNSSQRFVSDLSVVNIYHAPFLQNGNLSHGCQIFSGKSSPKDRSQDRKLLFKISSLLDKVRMSLCCLVALQGQFPGGLRRAEFSYMSFRRDACLWQASLAWDWVSMIASKDTAVD